MSESTGAGRPRPNAFVAITVLGVVLVMVRHAGVIVGPEAPTSVLSATPAVGIYILLAVSGYRLVPSWERRRDLIEFTGARVVRLVPALAVVTLVTAFVVGPLTTQLSTGQYLSHPQTYAYLSNIVFKPAYSLPLVFSDNPLPHVVNGSMWSLPAQFASYFFIPLVALVRVRWARGAVWAVLAAVAVVVSESGVLDGIVVWGSLVPDVVLVWPAFFVAAAVRELLGTPHLLLGAVAVALLLFIYLSHPQLIQLGLWVLLPLAVTAIGSAPIPVLRSAGRWGDPTYGIFLTGFPIQQLLVDGFGTVHPIASLGTAIAISAGLGFALASTVERPLILRFRSFSRDRALRRKVSTRTPSKPYDDPGKTTGVEAPEGIDALMQRTNGRDID